MKYGYENGKVEELIRNYKTDDNEMIITFLDGSKYTIPFTKEEENKILKQMLEQAKNRNESSALYDARYERKKAIHKTLTQIFCTIINGFSSHIYEETGWEIVFRILGGVTGIFIIIHGVDWKLKTDEIKELEKYDIYLSIMEKLDNTTNDNLFNGIKNRKVKLNINTLDNYSLKDIKRIKQNLIKFEEYNGVFEEKPKRKLLK